MKPILLLSTAAVLGLTACGSLNQPIASSDFDPLRAPGSLQTSAASTSTSTFKPGQFVKSILDNTAFYLKKPADNSIADKLLPQNTSMKVVSTTGNFVKVELDSGEVGYVPAVMVADPNTAPPTNLLENTAYPPLPSGSGPIEPLPVFDAAGQPPAGSIPTVIDPDAPVTETPVPQVTPTTDQFPTPPPLPPSNAKE